MSKLCVRDFNLSRFHILCDRVPSLWSYVTSSVKTRLMGKQKVQALIRRQRGVSSEPRQLNVWASAENTFLTFCTNKKQVNDNCYFRWKIKIYFTEWALHGIFLWEACHECKWYRLMFTKKFHCPLKKKPIIFILYFYSDFYDILIIFAFRMNF